MQFQVTVQEEINPFKSSLKANSKCEVVNDDDDDDDDDDDVHQAVVVDMSTGDDGASFRRHVIPVKPTGNKTAAICWQ